MLERKKKTVALLSILSNAIIILLKIVASVLCGSISILSEAVHSLGDLCASVLTLYSVSKACEPADKEHPFGHGKYEDLSGFIEGWLIIFAAVYIFLEAGKKLMSGNSVMDTTPALIVMGISFVLNIIVSSILVKTAKQTNSMALLADGQHLRSDIYSSFGVFVGLLVIKITGLFIIDSIIAIIVGLIILKTGIEVTKVSMNNLLDSSLPDNDIKQIEQILLAGKDLGVVGYKTLKARKLGAGIGIEVTLIFPKDMTIYKCHSICDAIELNLKDKFSNISASIHFEPDTQKNKAVNKS